MIKVSKLGLKLTLTLVIWKIIFLGLRLYISFTHYLLNEVRVTSFEYML